VVLNLGHELQKIHFQGTHTVQGNSGMFVIQEVSSLNLRQEIS
jgi:hypothetical protein